MLFLTLLAFLLASADGLVSGSPGAVTVKYDDCDTSDAKMDLPPNQTALVAPTTNPLFVLLGVGIQNYTCSGTAFTSIGAVASLFDISCLVDTPTFATVQQTAFNIWTDAPQDVPATSIGPLVGAPHLDGFHYFVTSPSGTGLSPEWDFTSTTGNATAFVLGAKVGDILAPADPATNIDWLSLVAVKGALASQIFRIDTCNVTGQQISVKYTSKYFLY
ncbi:hypothetical protein K438DRAFT_1900350 [Mycena galopus ATCC 62051]|nr:hypothetical protein K438DRAFT_1900350 [Mycena galopus ATCC 62051]